MSTAQDQRLSYESIIWVFGTTSLRPRQLCHKIIMILQALTELEENRRSADSPSWQWGGNDELQEAFYDLAKERGVVTGNAPRKAKDARVLTSGLVDLGLLTEERVVTDAGRELLAVTESSSEGGEEPETNIFAIDRESFVYLKQLLKASLRVVRIRSALLWWWRSCSRSLGLCRMMSFASSSSSSPLMTTMPSFLRLSVS